MTKICELVNLWFRH